MAKDVNKLIQKLDLEKNGELVGLFDTLLSQYDELLDAAEQTNDPLMQHALFLKAAQCQRLITNLVSQAKESQRLRGLK